MKTIFFECKKLFAEKANYFGFILLTFIFTIPLFLFTTAQENRYENELQYLRANLEYGEQAQKQMELEPAAAHILPDTIERNELLSAYIDALISGTDEERIKAEYAYEKKLLQNMESGILNGLSIIEQRKAVLVLENLVKNDINKVDDSFQASAPALNYVARIFSGTVSSSLIFSICALLFANIYSFEKRKNHINFFNVLPNRLESSLLSKVSTATVFVTLSLVIPLIIAFSISAFQNGIGDFRYPIAYSQNGVDVSLMTVTAFTSKSLLLFLLFILFLSSLSFFISLFTGSVLINAGILLSSILLVESPFLQSDSLKNVVHLLPFPYADPYKVLIFSDYNSPIINSSVNFQNGVLCLLMYAAVFFSLSFGIVIRRKKF
jgi:ABC-type transport system involved in multi-copper enzyme maturation permease subunit